MPMPIPGAQLPEGLTYVGPNEYRSASPLAGLPAVMLDDREVVFDSHRRAKISPAGVQHAGETPTLVSGRSTKKVRYEWPVFRETVTTRAMTGGLTPADALTMQYRIARGVEAMLASAWTTGKITWTDETEIDIWAAEGGATPYMSATTAWSAAGSDPLADILAAGDLMVQSGARPAKRLLLGSQAAAAFLSHEKVQKILDVRRIEAGNMEPRRAPGVLPLSMPAVWMETVRPGSQILDEQTYVPDLGSFASLGMFAGIEIYRDCVGLLPAKQGILLSRAGLMAGDLDADFYLGVGYPWVCGEQVRQPGGEVAIYKSQSPDGQQLDSYSFVSLQWSNVYGAINMRGLVA